MKKRIILATFLAITASIATIGLFPHSTSAEEASVNVYVSPTGKDTNAGTSTSTAYQHIQKALDVAKPGTTINLAPGDYVEALVTKAAGTATAPITIKGSETSFDSGARHKTTLYPPFDGGDALDIFHSYYTLDGFTIDGQYTLKNTVLASDPTALVSQKNTLNANGSAGVGCDQAKGDIVCDNRLVYVGRNSAINLTSIKINNMLLTRAGGECVRLHNNTAASTVTNSVINYCGMNYKDTSSSGYAYHNGEAVYIGTSTSTSQRDQAKHPLWGKDTSSGNVVRNNIISTYGSECFEVKEEAHDNTFDHNTCSYSLELPGEDSSLSELRGDHNTISSNKFYYSTGAGIKMRTDSTPTAKTFDGLAVQNPDKGGNVIKNNTYDKMTSAMLLVDTKAALGTICGNSYNGTLTTGDNAKLAINTTTACTDGSINSDAGANIATPASQSLCTPATTPTGIGTAGGSVQKTITVSAAGTYKLFFRVKGTPLASGYLAQLSVDGCQDYLTAAAGSASSSWYWAGTSSQNATYTLTAGTHTIAITNTSAVPDFALDVFTYTTNLDCVPTGTDGACQAPTSPTTPTTPVAQITSISPRSGPASGGMAVTLKVANLATGTPSISVGDKKAENVKRVSDDTITFTTPKHDAGDVAVTATLGSSKPTSTFTYIADVVSTTPPTTGGGSTGTGGSTGSGGTTTTPPTSNVSLSVNFKSDGSDKNMEVVAGGKFGKDDDYYKLADVSNDKLNMSLLKTALTGNYRIAVVSYAKKTDPTNNNAIVFSYTDKNNYSFVSFAEKADDSNNGFFQVKEGKTTKLASISVTTPTGSYQTLAITKVGSQVSAFLNGAAIGSVSYTGLQDARFGIRSVNTSLRISSISANTIN